MNKHYFRSVILATVLIALFLVVSTVGATSGDGLIVSLSTQQDEYNSSQDVEISVNIANPTKHSIRILKWFTPISGIEEPIFTVMVDGEPVEYTGALYKRPAATGNDYITLKSGKSVTYGVNLADYYDLSKTGQYEIYYDAASLFLFTDKGNSSKNPDSLKSKSISLKVEGREPKGKPTPPPPPPEGGNAFNACSLTQQSILTSARQKASNYATIAENYLAGTTDTIRYKEWFGLFDISRHDTVSSHFVKISDAWTNAGVTFDCKCKQNYYAYVYPTRPYNIYLCKVFWLAPLTGTDSQAGTLIHEMSHFTNVASTDDYVYGQTGARSLAISNPDNAVMNADNHEYFAENNPILP